MKRYYDQRKPIQRIYKGNEGPYESAQRRTNENMGTNQNLRVEEP